MHDSCTKQIFITDTHHPGSFMRSLSFDLKRPTNRGTRGVHVQRSCPSDSLPHIRKCPRLPAGNWLFQGRRLNSSSWLYLGRERRWFSSSWFLGRGCKRRTKRSRGANCLSQRSKSDEAQRKRSRRESCEWLSSLQIKARIYWRPLIPASLSFHSLRWIDGSENEQCYACTPLIYLEKHHAWMSLELISQVHTHMQAHNQALLSQGEALKFHCRFLCCWNWLWKVNFYFGLIFTHDSYKRETIDEKHFMK